MIPCPQCSHASPTLTRSSGSQLPRRRSGQWLTRTASTRPPSPWRSTWQRSSTIAALIAAIPLIQRPLLTAHQDDLAHHARRLLATSTDRHHRDRRLGTLKARGHDTSSLENASLTPDQGGPWSILSGYITEVGSIPIAGVVTV